MAEMYLTPEQVAARLQMHPETVRRWLKEGLVRGVQRGRAWRIPESALDGAGRVQSRPAAAGARTVQRDLALFEDLQSLVRTLPNRRANAGLPPLTDDEIFAALYDER